MTTASVIAAVDASARDRREAWWFFAIALLVLGAGYGLRDPWPADEPRFVLVAQQMLDGGDWLFPHRGDELYPDKPPLFFWLLAGAKTLLHSWRWSFLLPSLLAALGTLALVRDLGRRLWNPRAGLWAAGAVLCALQFVYQAKRAQIDPALVFLTTLAFYGLCRHLLLGPNWRWFWAGCFAAGLGVVLKGVGFLPLLALLPFAAMRRARWQGLVASGPGDGRRWAGGALAFVAALALWLAPMVGVALAGGDPEHRAYLDEILFRQTATRYAGAWHHHQPAWYFLGVIALFWAPFSIAFAWLWRDWREAWRARDGRVWLPLAWGLLVVVFFSASPGKRDMYILPALPAFALAAAPFLGLVLERNLLQALPDFLGNWIGKRRIAGPVFRAIVFRHVLLGFVLLLGVLLLALGAWGLTDPPKLATLAADRGLDPAHARGLWWMFAVVGAIGLAGGAAWRTTHTVRAMALLLGALWVGYGFVVHPLLDASSSGRDLMLRVQAALPAEAPIGLVRWKEQYLLQARNPARDFGYRAEPGEQWARALAWQRDGAGRWLLLEREETPPCVPASAAKPVGRANRRDWWLLDADATAACPAPPPAQSEP